MLDLPVTTGRAWAQISVVACGRLTGDVGCREPTASVGSAIVLFSLMAVVFGVAVWIHRSNKGRKRKDGGEL